MHLAYYDMHHLVRKTAVGIQTEDKQVRFERFFARSKVGNILFCWVKGRQYPVSLRNTRNVALTLTPKQCKVLRERHNQIMVKEQLLPLLGLEPGFLASPSQHTTTKQQGGWSFAS